MSVLLNQARVEDDPMELDQNSSVTHPNLDPSQNSLEHASPVSPLSPKVPSEPIEKPTNEEPLNKPAKGLRRAIRKILNSAPNDLYGIANSTKSDATKTIKKNLNRISKLVHPDKVPKEFDIRATIAQARINNAREVLLDPSRTTKFDTEGVYTAPQAEEDRNNPDFAPNAWDDDSDLDSDSDSDSDDGDEDEDEGSQDPPDEYIKSVYAEATTWVQQVLKKGQNFNRNPTGEKEIQFSESKEFEDIKTKQKEFHEKIKAHNESKKVEKTRHTFDITTVYLSNSEMAKKYVEIWTKNKSNLPTFEFIVYYSNNIKRVNKEEGYPLEWNFYSFKDPAPSDIPNESVKDQDQSNKKGKSSGAGNDAGTNGSSGSQGSQSQEIKPLKSGFTTDGEKIVGKLPKTVYSSYTDTSIITECKFFVEVYLQNRKNQSIFDIELRTEADIGFKAARSYLYDLPEEEQVELLEIYKNEKGRYRRQFQGITGVTAQEYETLSDKRLPPTYVRGKFKDGRATKEYFMTRTTLRTILGHQTADQLIQQHYNQYDIEVKEPPWPKCMDWKPTRKAIRGGRSLREQEQSDSESEENHTPKINKGRNRIARSETPNEIETLTQTVEKLKQDSQQNDEERNRLMTETVSKEVAKAVAQMMMQIQQEFQIMSIKNQTSG
ncbi:1c046ada-0b87-407a-a382-ba992f0ebb5a [Sclerotinia trifoliorum]|uniref:1c046ada-0b87-407a-a382-ba992f0ebb5a n=1 Tax=Sclerotinia trifoliorum TaxID=28548 RepID=A0A8H2VY60_9HELO|nr:1c046ada-0b87-407a-a382-ba992f0ebb5a [Sclerotinia trifoliorum]